MSYEVSIVADSVSEAGARITTFQLKYPMKIHWDLLTHRALSRNASSGRAISVARMAGWVRDDPFKPPAWTADATQMKPGRPLGEAACVAADQVWAEALADAVRHAERLAAIGVHRQDANGLLVPFGHINVLITATDFSNFFALRCTTAARPEFTILAVKMARAYRDSTPKFVEYWEWHLPYVTDEEHNEDFGDDLRAFSVARCARVSYKTFEGKDPDSGADIRLHDQLRDNGHWSPFEHQAHPVANGGFRSGNFRGWEQYRSCFPKGVHTSFDMASLDQFEGRDFIV